MDRVSTSLVSAGRRFGSGSLFAQPVYAARRRLADAVGVAVPVRGRADVGVPARCPADRRRALRSQERRAVIAGLLPRRHVRRQFGDVLRRRSRRSRRRSRRSSSTSTRRSSRSCRSGSAHRLQGRRAWIALGIALIGVVLAVGGIDPNDAPPVSGLAARLRLVLHLRRLGDPRRADLGRTTRDRRRRVRPDRVGDGDRGDHHDGDRHGLLGRRPRDRPTGPARPDPVGRLGRAHRRRCRRDVHRHPDLLRRARCGSVPRTRSLISTAEPIWTIASAAILFSVALTARPAGRRRVHPGGRRHRPDRTGRRERIAGARTGAARRATE